MSTKEVKITVSPEKKMVLMFKKESDIWVCKITNEAMNEIDNYRGDNIQVTLNE